ncbi:hypothetical protein F4803DRAFT_503911 [Xylaria telfairii]|nr:hypothetical protein F4803DRAFT_503911 [Xylaria telfairii]
MADIVSIQLVLSELPRGLVGTRNSEKIKKSALLVNMSQGPIVDEVELLQPGKKGLIRGIGLDVYGLDPLPKDSEWQSTRWMVQIGKKRGDVVTPFGIRCGRQYSRMGRFTHGRASATWKEKVVNGNGQ